MRSRDPSRTQGPTGNSDVDELLGNLASNLLAGGGGALVGGSAGALTSAATDRFNRQLSPKEEKIIAEQAGADQSEQDRLARAACYAVKCWAEYKPGSQEYTANYVSQLEASQLGPELAWVDRQKEAGLFDYSPGQKITDMVKNDPLGTVKDAAKVALGGVTVKTGATICATTGAGCATAGGWIFAFGLSDMAEGATGLYNRYNGVNSPGINPLRYQFNQVAPIWGDTAYDAAKFAFGIAALKAPVPLRVGVADGLNRPSSMFDVTVPRIKNATLIPFLNKTLPPSTTQGILLYGIGSNGAAVIKDIHDVGGDK